MASSFLNKKAQEQRNKRNQSSGSSGKASSFLNKKAQEQREAREAKSTAASNALAANNPGYVAAQKYGNGKTGTAANKVVKGTSQQSTERKPGQTNALGGGTYNKTKLDSTLNAAVYNTAGTLANLWGTIQALDESLKGTDEYTAVGGLNKITDREGDKKKAMEANRVKSVFNTADTLMQRSAEEQEEAKEGLGKFGQGLVDFGVAGAQFAGDIAANAILPGLGAVAMGARAAGGGAYEARQTGLDLDQQLTAGAKSAAIELLTEKLFGAGSKIAYGSGIIKNQNVVNGLVNNMAKTDKGRTALKVLAAANEEGLEEVLSDVLNPIADRILNLQDSEGNYLSSWDAEQMLEDYIIGAALGAFGAGANVVSGEYKAENAQQRAYEDYQKALVNAGLAAEQGSNAQVTAAEYQKILDQSSKRGNRNLSDRETENMLNLLHIEQDAPDVSARLQSLGQSADTETVNAIVKAVNGEKLSRKEQQAFSANPYSQRVVNEMTDTEGVTSNGWYADRASGAAYTPQNTGVSAETAQQALDIARRQRAAAGAATFNPTASVQGMNAVAAARNAAGQAAVQRVAAVQNVTESIASDINVAPEVVQQVYNLKADTSPEVFKAAFKTAYTMGEQGAKETALSSIKALSPQQASIAYNIGMEKAAAAANTQEVNESGVHLRGSGQRINGQNTAGQVSGLAESTGRNTSGQAQGQPRNGAKTARNDGQEVVYNGAKQKGVRYTAGKKTESMRKAEKTAKSRGYSTVFFEGGNIKVDGGEARGIIDPDTKTVYVRTDHPDFTANQIMRHEMGHADIAEGKISLDKVREDLHERFTDAELDEIAQAYADAYEGANMTIEEAFEEICCDALGDMNVFAGTGRIDDTRYGQTLTSTKKSAERQANQGRAPPKDKGAKYSRDKYWRPQLNKNEWSLLNYALDNELATSDNYIDNETKWLYKNSKGTKVFAIYGIGDGTDATVLYAVGGERASEAIKAFDKEGENFAQYNGEKPSEWIERIWRKSEKQSNNSSNDVRGARDGRDGGLHGRSSRRDGRTTVSESVRNSKPRVKEKFSMEKPIEEKKNLIALHNLDETKLIKTLKLGGFPMPSIAITKSDIPHTNFGDITVVFGKETIDPKFDKRNTVYSADAWTPLFPRIEYEANPDVEARIRNKYYKLAGKYGYELLKPMYSSANYVDDVLNNYGGEQGVIEHFADDTDMMQVFLADTTGKTVDNIKTEHVSRLSDNQIEEYDALIDGLGVDVIKDMIAKAGQSPMTARRAWLDKHGDELKAAYRQYLIKSGLSEETADDVMKNMKVGSLLPKVIGARNYLKNGAETRREEVDISATKDAIRNAVDMQKYKTWLKELYNGVEKSSGVYNQKDFYTASGNRRSFKQTHFPATLDGIVKAMAAQGDGNSRNVMGFHGVKSLRAGTAERFKSIEDMHKLEGRLKHLTQEEADEISDALDSRLSALMHEIYNNVQHGSYDNELIELNALGEVFVEAAQLKYKSPANIKALFKKYGNTLSDEQSQDVVALLFDINQMPVNIYEAKPERAVGFDEIRAVIIPDTASNELRSELKAAGVSNVMEYKRGNDAQRMELANSVEDVHFSLESKQLTELRRENERKLAEATEADAQNENERGLIKSYKKQYNKVLDIAEQLDAAKQELSKAEADGAANDATKAQNRVTLLNRQYSREHKKLNSYQETKALQNVLSRVNERTAAWVKDAQEKGHTKVHPISSEQQENAAKQQHRAPQEVPKKDPKGKLTSKHVSTIVNSGITPAEFSAKMLEDAEQGKFSHIAYSDEEALAKATKKIETNGWEDALAEYKANINSGKTSKDITVMGIALYNNAVNNGDYVTAMDIASLMVKNSKTTAQALQAMRILNRLSPECRLYLAARSVENIQEELNERYKDNKADIHVDKVLYDEYANALRSGEEDKIKESWAKIEQNVAQQIDATWYEKLNQFRYLAMLGNPRTHIRNIVGNAFFVPVRAVKNTIAYGLETAADKATKGGIEKSKAILNPSDANDTALIKYANLDYDSVQDAIMGGGKYVDTFQGVDKYRTIYKKIKPLENLSKGNSKLLDKEDAWFCKPAYAHALAKWYKANGISAEQLAKGDVPEETIIRAQTTAIKEAQKATYRDLNWFSEKVSLLNRVKNKPAKVLVEGLMPFKKTPANILSRALEYSPAGLIKTLAVDTKKLKEYVNGDVENGMSPAQYIDNISSGLTGTALMGLGVLLASMGLLSGGDGDDEKQNNFDELKGNQNYALNVGGMSITLDWLAPESMPLFVGVELFNAFRNENENDDALGNFIGSLMDLADPMLEMSMLQSVSDLFDNLQNIEEGHGIYRIVSGMATSYITQYFPTLFGQVERAFTEEERETTYIDRNSKANKELRYLLAQIANKIPGYDYSQIPYIDAWGRRESTGNLLERTFNNFLNPAYVKEERNTPIDSELERLYELGETSVYPTRAATNTQIKGKYLTADEYVTYATEKGQISYDMAEQIINSSTYRSATDGEKAYMLETAYRYANNIAKYKVNNDYDVNGKWIMTAYESGNPAPLIIDHAMEWYKEPEE